MARVYPRVKEIVFLLYLDDDPTHTKCVSSGPVKPGSTPAIEVSFAHTLIYHMTLLKTLSRALEEATQVRGSEN